MSTYDHDPQGALTGALRLVLDMPHADLAELLVAAGAPNDVIDDVAARDRLLRDLNELRQLPRNA